MPVFSRLAVAVQLFAVILSPVLGAAAKPQYDYVIGGRNTHAMLSEKEEQALAQFPKKKKAILYFR